MKLLILLVRTAHPDAMVVIGHRASSQLWNRPVTEKIKYLVVPFSLLTRWMQHNNTVGCISTQSCAQDVHVIYQCNQLSSSLFIMLCTFGTIVGCLCDIGSAFDRPSGRWRLLRPMFKMASVHYKVLARIQVGFQSWLHKWLPLTLRPVYQVLQMARYHTLYQSVSGMESVRNGLLSSTQILFQQLQESLSFTQWPLCQAM